MKNAKVTGEKAATAASKTLQSDSTGSKSKTAAGSALSQTGAPKSKPLLLLQVRHPMF